ncbi:hypothetical protein FLX56_28695 [Synechococcus moorigangaii CMS01]|nr:hypothetical protein [Synechococcus moorigangaii CMS01]
MGGRVVDVQFHPDPAHGARDDVAIHRPVAVDRREDMAPVVRDEPGHGRIDTFRDFGWRRRDRSSLLRLMIVVLVRAGRGARS